MPYNLLTYNQNKLPKIEIFNIQLYVLFCIILKKGENQGVIALSHWSNYKGDIWVYSVLFFYLGIGKGRACPGTSLHGLTEVDLRGSRFQIPSWLNFTYDPEKTSPTTISCV